MRGPIGTRATLIAMAWFFGVFSLWALSSPIMGVPDEPAHTIKAAALWQGELRGTEVRIASAAGSIPADRVEVPEAFASANDVPGCYAGNPEVSVACAPDLSGSAEKVATVTTAGPYPPLYYAVVGWPSRLWANDGGAYLMRLASAAAGAVLCGLALRSLTRVLALGPAVVALTLAMTPMVPFLVGSINPAGLEIAAAMLFWAATLALASRWDPGSRLERGLLVEFFIGFAVLTNTRGLGPVFALFTLGSVALFVGWRRFRSIAGDRRAWIVAVGLVVIGAVAGLWTLVNGQFSAVPGGALPKGSNPLIVLLGLTDDWLRQAVAIFGWLDTGPLAAVVFVWSAAVFMVLAAVVVYASRRRQIVVWFAAAAVVFLPVLLQLQTVQRDGIAWQGRYILPLAVGIPMLAVASVTHGRASPLGAGWWRLCVWVTALCAFGMTYSQYSWLRRSAVGDGSRALSPLSWSGWTPPLPAWLILAGTIVLALVPIAVVVGLADQSSPNRGDDGIQLGVAESRVHR